MPSNHIEWVFKDGKKFPSGGTRSGGTNPKMVMESMSSNGLTKYLAILWNDGVITCDCRGWAILKKDSAGNPKPRTCRHCKLAAENSNGAMTPVADFVPDASQLARPQINFGERQLRKIRLKDTVKS